MDVLDAVKMVKKCEPMVADDLGNLQDLFQTAVTQKIQGDALKNIGNLAMLGAGTGAGIRGLQGLFSLINRNTERNVKPKPRTAVVNVPVARMPKVAEEGKAANWWTGSEATTPAGIPLYYPAAVAAGGLGAAGGWKLIDYILDKRRSQETDDDLDAARQDYELALRNEPAAARVAGKFAESLDKLADKMEECVKTAALSDILGGTVGSYLGFYALPSATLAAVIAHGMGKSRQRKSLLERAQKKRMRELASSQPVTLFASPSTVRTTKNIPSSVLSGSAVPSDAVELDKEDPQRYSANA